jgi:hypothetical protein
MKIVVIPSDSLDISGISIPREWVDIPQWTPDYYLAAQLDLEQNTILLWGYVHSNTIKQQAVLNHSHQYYTLPLEKMSLDLELFGITQQLVVPPQFHQQSFITANSLNKKDALEKLSTLSPYSPRLDLPFETWSALISDRQWCQELYQQRCLNSLSKSSSTNLLQWLKQEVVSTISSGWQELSEVVSASSQTPQLSFALRNENLRLQEDSVKKAKVIDLKLQLHQSTKIILLIAISQKAEDKYSIVAQLHPDTEQKFLSEAIDLELIYDAKTLQAATSRSQDRYMQIGFVSPIDTSFKIKITYQQQVYFEEVFQL